MIFKPGDKVVFKNEKQKGIILRVNSLYKVLVETADGFKVNVLVNDLVRVERGTDKSSAYGEIYSQKDRVDSKNRRIKKQKNCSVLKVDLHIEILTSNYNYMHNSEILQMQLNECHNKLKEALKSSFEKLIIVHGVGTGILKNEVHKLLNNYQLRYYLLKDGGATEVVF